MKKLHFKYQEQDSRPIPCAGSSPNRRQATSGLHCSLQHWTSRLALFLMMLLAMPSVSFARPGDWVLVGGNSLDGSKLGTKGCFHLKHCIANTDGPNPYMTQGKIFLLRDLGGGRYESPNDWRNMIFFYDCSPINDKTKQATLNFTEKSLSSRPNFLLKQWDYVSGTGEWNGHGGTSMKVPGHWDSKGDVYFYIDCDIYIPIEYANQRFKIYIWTCSDDGPDNGEFFGPFDTFNFKTPEIKYQLSEDHPGKIEMTYNVRDVGNSSYFQWFFRYTGDPYFGGQGRRYVPSNVNETGDYSGTYLYDISSRYRDAKVRFSYLRDGSSLMPYEFMSDNYISVPAYVWPEEKDIHLSYDPTGKVTVNFTVPTVSSNQCIQNDRFEVQRSLDPNFTNDSEITNVGSITYDPSKSSYTLEDNLSDVNIQGRVYYRIRRTKTAFNWDWNYCKKSSIEVHSELSSVSATVPVDVDTIAVDPVTKDTTKFDFPTAIIRWKLNEKIWPSDAKLVIKARNLTAGKYEEIASLQLADAKKGYYYDEGLTPCNEMQYTLQVVTENSEFSSTPLIIVPGSALTSEIGTIKDLEVSKGYYADRVELKWKTVGTFDAFRVRRVEYGKTGVDTFSVATVNMTGSDLILAEDTKGAPGVYYKYLVDGFVVCNKKPLYCETVLEGIGFRAPTGSIYGRVTYKKGQAVSDVEIRLESDVPNQGRSLKLDGKDDYLEVQKEMTLGQVFTLQAYVAPENVDHGTIFSKPGSCDLSFVNGKFSFTVNNQTLTADYNRPTGFDYTHITAVRDTSRLLLYINGKCKGEIECPADKDPVSSKVYMGKNKDGNFYQGNLDEVRLWSVALDSTTIRRDYNRQLYGGENGLQAYWRLNDGVEGEFYDLSSTGNDYHTNHGVIHGAVYDTMIPSDDQLGLKGITDEKGNYGISGIPYQGQGTMYRIIPKYENHQFDPVQQQRLIANGALTHTCDFTDNSSFSVSGHVYYENSTIPVKGAEFLIDGNTAMKDNGEVCVTDEAGRFSIDVPVGIHDVRVKKVNHSFCGKGRITKSDGTDRNYQDHIEGIVLYDSTRVKFIGRVAGGALQDSYPLGHSMSKNNLSESLTVALKLVASTGDLCVSKKDSVVKEVAYCPGNQRDDKKKWEKNHYSTINYNIRDNQIEITPDLETGEFTVWLFPENYNVIQVDAPGYGNILEKGQPVNINLEGAFARSASLHNYKDSVRVGKEWVYTDYVDSVEYNFSYKFIKRMAPSIEVKQLKPYSNTNVEDYFGLKEVLVNTIAGDTIAIPVWDEKRGYLISGKCVYHTDQNYGLRVSAFEEFKKFKKDGLKTVGQPDRVPVSDGMLTFNNNFGNKPVVDTVKVDSTGMAIYKFAVGEPNLSDDSALKNMGISLQIQNRVINWNDGKPLEAIVIGDKMEGVRFVTQGPDQVKMILRDPPGSHSYSYIDEGLTVSSSNTYVGSVAHDGLEVFTQALGMRTMVMKGVGIYMSTTTDFTHDMSKGVHHFSNMEGRSGYNESTTYQTKIQTSDENQYVGADGDLFIGNSSNITFGTTACVTIIEKEDLRSDEKPLYHFDKDGKNYVVIRGKGISAQHRFATAFQYPQAFIERTMIPDLRKMRNGYLLPNTLTDVEAQRKADNEKIQVYLSRLDNDDPDFGKDNLDKAFKNVAGFDKAVFYDGPSYKIFFPSDELMSNDTVMYFNQQIQNWENILRQNEREKLAAETKENKSFHAGSVVEYSETYSHANVEHQTWSIGVGGKMMGNDAILLNKNGWTLHWEESMDTNHGGDYEQNQENTCQIGYVLADEGSTDYHSVDICTVPYVGDVQQGDKGKKQRMNNFVFKLRGGATSCPYEEGYVTKYYNKGTVIDQKTAQIEVPTLRLEQVSVTDVPASRRAVFKLIMGNASEIASDCIYDLNVIESSNPDGAKFYIDGTPLGNGRSFLIPAGEPLVKTLEVGMGTKLEYKNLQLVLHSQCQYSTLDFKDNIESIANLSVTFVPACSDIHLASPKDKWVLNDTRKFHKDDKFIMPLKIDGYNSQYRDFECVKIQYKPSAASDIEWNTVMCLYADSAAAQKAPGKFGITKDYMPKGGVIDYAFDMTSLKDQSYDICAVTVCRVSPDKTVETVSNIATGIKDTKRPQLFGSAQPANGILGVEDEIRLNFNETIAEGLLADENFEVTGIRNGELVNRSASVRFDGDNDYLTTETERNFADKSFTVETGLFIDRLDHESTIFSQGNANNSFEISLMPDKHLKIKLGNETIVTDDTIKLLPQRWEHLAVVYSNGFEPKLSVYYNMDLVINKVVSPYTGIGNFEIGRSVSGHNNYFTGKLSELRVWNQALARGIIDLKKNVSLRGSEMGLIAYYPMNECRGKLVLDKARGANAVMKDAQWYIDRDSYAAQFDGNGYLKLSTGSLPITPEKDYTLEFWFKGEPGQKNVALFSNGRGDNEEEGGSSGKMYIGFDENGKLVLKSNGYTHVSDAGDYLDNAWHHFALAVSRTIGRASVYLDGNLSSYFDAAALHSITADYTYLGARGWYAKGNAVDIIIDQQFKGSIDELRIWDLYKNETLLQKENNVCLKGSEMGLFTYYPFEKNIVYQGTPEMQFTVEDRTIRTKGGLVVAPAENSNVVPTLDVAPVKERGAVIPIQVNYVVNNDALIITPSAAGGWDDYEESIVTFKVEDVQDVHGNKIESPVAWTAYIDRNQLRWVDDEMNIEKEVYEAKEFELDIVNLGGSVQRYTIENCPSWLRISPESGSIDPKETVHLNFKVEEGLNVGTYDESIYLVNENGVARTLSLNVRVKGEKPNWAVNPKDYKYNMSVYGKIRINNLFSADKEDLLAAFMNGKCVGLTHSKYFEDEDMWYTFLTVYGNEIQQEGLEFRIWDASSGKVYLAKGDQGPIPFINNSIVGSPDRPVIFDGEEMMVQNIALNPGWNWISFNLTNDHLSDVNFTLANGRWSSNDEVKSATGTDSYSEKSGKWFGSLSSQGGFNNLSMYMVNSSDDQILSLSGQALSPHEQPITVNPNWNYIGYLPSVNMTVKEALTDYKAEKGDVIKSQTAFAMYSENMGWVGNLTFMEANKGYMLYRNPASASVSFRYPTNKGSLSGQMSAPRVTSGIEANYRYADNMNVIAVPAPGYELRPSDQIVAYVNGEPRGKAQSVEIGSGQAVWFFNIAGEYEAPVTFAVERDGEQVAATEPVFNYQSNDLKGSLQTPVVLDFLGQNSGINVYPRLFDKQLNVSVVKALAQTVEISVYNLNGQLETKRTARVENGTLRCTLDVAGLTQGQYLVSVAVNGGKPSVFKVEKK